MRKIQMVDLQAQYQHIQQDIDTRIREVLDSAQFVRGPQVQQFADELADYLHVGHVIPVANGTEALQIALMTLGLKPGDEVITPTFTFIATAEVVALLGLKPVVVDVDWNTFNISVEAVRRAITSRTRAIVPVHLFGQCANMQPLLDLARKHQLYVIEDACQAIGADCWLADGKAHKAGTMGDIGCTSFFPSKNLGCYGDGGALFTNDDVLAQRIRCIANHGMTVRYHHDMVGVNSRLDTLQAAILRAKLPYLNDYTEARRRAAAYYDEALGQNKHILLPARAEYSTHVFHQYTLRLVEVDRDAVKARLAEAGIPAMVYYPRPLHMQKAYLDSRYKEGDFPIAERLAECVLSLPMHTELDDEQLNYIASTLLQILSD